MDSQSRSPRAPIASSSSFVRQEREGCGRNGRRRQRRLGFIGERIVLLPPEGNAPAALKQAYINGERRRGRRFLREYPDARTVSAIGLHPSCRGQPVHDFCEWL